MGGVRTQSARCDWLPGEHMHETGKRLTGGYIQIGGLSAPAPSCRISERFEIPHVQSGIPLSPFLHWAISSFFGLVVILLFLPCT